MEVTKENVWKLSEAEVFDLFLKVESEPSSEKKSDYMKFINLAFEFRTVSKRRKAQQEALKLYGFHFFQRKDCPEKVVGICKRKTQGNSVF